MAEAKRGRCACCGKDCTLTVDGRIWHHHPEGENAAECYQSPDSKRCKGAGELPEGARPEATPGSLRFLCRVPSGPDGCGHPVQLTSNNRARSHLTPQGTKCTEGGSAFPIAVDVDGYRADTAEWSEAQWKLALPRLEPRDAFELADGRNSTVQPRTVETVDLPHDPHRHEADVAIAEAERIQREQDADYEQSLRDGLEESRRRAGLAKDIRPDVFDVTHRYTDASGQTWIHPGEAGACRLPDCCTHPRGFDWGDDGAGHSGSFCFLCGEPEPEAPPAPAPEPEWSPVGPVGELERGAFFRRHLAKGALADLVYRVEVAAVTEGIVQALIVSAGRHHGRIGELTNLSEEITCTDKNGQRLRRPALGTGAISPSSPVPQPPTPSPSPSGPEPTAAPARSSTPRTAASATPPTASPAETSKRATSSGPTAKAATSTPSASTRKADVPDAFSTAKQTATESDKYDRYGRYKMVHPVGGKKVAWTRATTFAKSIQDTFALSQWAQRMTLKGAALRSDIVAAVSTLDVKEDKDRVNALVEDAKKAAGNKVAANLGTAVHAFTEDRDKALVGQPVKAKAIPDDLRPTVDAYELLLRDFGLEPVPGLIEFTTAVQQYEIAGTSDRCYKVTRDITFKINKRTVTLYAGEYVIGDVKTGADLSYGWLEICIQLAIYAQGLNTSGVWDWNTCTWGKPVLADNPDVLLKVRTDVALIPHLPVDRKEGDPLATLFAIDLDAGWAACVLCAQVRTTRKQGSTLATALSVADVDEGEVPEGNVVGTHASGVLASRPATLEDKAKAVTTQEAASAVWKEAVAARTPKPEVDRLVSLMQAKLSRHVEKGA